MCLSLYVAYLRQFFYPAGLAVMYLWQDVDLPLWKVIGALLILAAITTAAVLCRLKRPYFLVGWLWYLGMLVPVIGLVQVGGASHGGPLHLLAANRTVTSP